MKKDKSSSLADKFLPGDIQNQLRTMFSALPHDVPIYLVSRKTDEKKEIEIARDLLTAFAQVSDKIKFTALDFSDPRVAKWGVWKTPTLVFAPDLYKIHYLGVPLGEEGRTLVETMLLVGARHSHFNDQAAGVLKRLAEERRLRVFVSPSCPYCPQQAVNAVKAAIERPDLVSVEVVDTAFNSDLAEKYSAFSVPQTFSDDLLIAKGAQPQELFVASVEKNEEATYFIPSSDAPRIEADLVIIGGGPAGLTAGIYAARSGLKAVIVEKENLGGQVALTPVVENYPGLSRIGGKNLVDIMVAHALEYAAVFPREEVLELTPGDPIRVRTTLREFTARAVLFATGAKHKNLGAAGEQRFAGRGVSYCSTCDGPLFKGRKVFMVGGGNSAITEALHLHHIGANVSLVHRRDTLRAQEQLVKDLQDKNIPILWNTEIEEVRGQERMTEVLLHDTKTGASRVVAADGLFVAIGYEPSVELAKKIGLELNEEGYIKTDGRHRTAIRGIYSAGDVEGGYKQIVTAAGAGAAAAMVIFEDLTHPYWTHQG